MLGQLAFELLLDEAAILGGDSAPLDEQVGNRFRFVGDPRSASGGELREFDQIAIKGQHRNEQVSFGGHWKLRLHQVTNAKPPDGRTETAASIKHSASDVLSNEKPRLPRERRGR